MLGQYAHGWRILCFLGLLVGLHHRLYAIAKDDCRVVPHVIYIYGWLLQNRRRDDMTVRYK